MVTMFKKFSPNPSLCNIMATIGVKDDASLGLYTDLDPCHSVGKIKHTMIDISKYRGTVVAKFMCQVHRPMTKVQ